MSKQSKIKLTKEQQAAKVPLIMDQLNDTYYEFDPPGKVSWVGAHMKFSSSMNAMVSKVQESKGTKEGKEFWLHNLDRLNQAFNMNQILLNSFNEQKLFTKYYEDLFYKFRDENDSLKKQLADLMAENQKVKEMYFEKVKK